MEIELSRRRVAYVTKHADKIKARAQDVAANNETLQNAMAFTLADPPADGAQAQIPDVASRILADSMAAEARAQAQKERSEREPDPEAFDLFREPEDEPVGMSMDEMTDILKP
jgi:hypothetical protein